MPPAGWISHAAGANFVFSTSLLTAAAQDLHHGRFAKHPAVVHGSAHGHGGGVAPPGEQQPMEIKDLGLTEGGVWYRTNIEHDVGMMVEDPFSALRLSSVTNAAIVK